MNGTQATCRSIQQLDDSELATLYTDQDETVRAMVAREGDRRDARDRQRARDAAMERDWRENVLEPDLALAESVINGYFLSREGLAKKATVESLWRGREDLAWKYASEELRNFWLDVRPRVTLAQWKTQSKAPEREVYRHCVRCGWDFRHYQTRATCFSDTACERRQADPTYRVRKVPQAV